MLRQITTGLTLMISVAAFSQVGIDTDTPQATLDVVGKPADASILDGIIAPRIEGAQLRAKTYTLSQTGALVYVTLADTAPVGQTEDVTAEGYYYFNGTKWVKSGASDMVNIYNADGTLTSTRTLNQNGKSLTFSNIQSTTFYNDAGLGILQSSGTGNRASIALSTASGYQMQLFTDNNASAQLRNTAGSTGLIIGNTYTTNPGFVSFETTSASGAAGVERMRINSIGNVGINTQNLSTEKFDVNGITRLRNLPLNGATNAIFTTAGGSASATQDQTFTATRTLVADANGVVGYVTGLPNNIYNANGFLTNNRTLTLNGKELNFTGTNQRTSWRTDGVLYQENLQSSGGEGSIVIAGGSSSNLYLQQFRNGAAQIQAAFNSTSLDIGTNGSTLSAPLTISTSAGGGALATEKMRVTGEGNVGIATITPTERFHNSGNVRLQGLPLNGATNAIFTTSGGGASTTQNQTFTATRTLVSDANGVLGYISGLPSTTTPTGFERLPDMTATNFYWKLIGAPTANYGTAGKYSVDASWNPTNLSETIGGIPYSTILTLSGMSIADMGARGQNAFAAGAMNSASGAASATFGGGNQASGTGSFAAGILNKATGDNSIAMGQSSQATGNSAIALGNTNLASAENSVAIGQANQATAQGTLALGNTNKATAISAIAMGQQNEANGQSSIAIGNTNIANGQSSVAIGHRLTTSVQYSTAMGLFNKSHAVSAPAERLFVIGNGTGDSDALRSDAFTVLKNGKVGVDIDNFETTTSTAKLEVNGQIRVRPENTTVTCDAANEGSIRYFTVDANNGEFRGCKKTSGAFAWVSL